MNTQVVRLIGAIVLAAFSAGICMGGITRGESGKMKARGARESSGLHELLEYIYQCRGCEADHSARSGDSGWAYGAGWHFPAVIELPTNSPSMLAIWLATGPKAVEGNSVDPEVTQTLAYLGGNWGSYVSARARAFEGGPHGRSGESHGFGHKPDSLAAVPEPAPIFLLGTILLATFSIARLRFNR